MNLKLLLEEIETSQYQIYQDIDGCLADFENHYEHFTGKLPDEAERDLIQQYGKKIGKNKFWEPIDGLGAKFWSEMPWMKDGKELWNFVKQYKPKLLSSPSRSSTSREGKKIWANKNTPGTELILRYANQKHEFSGPKNILIDDRADTCQRWKDAGGIVICHKNAKDTIKQLQKLGFGKQEEPVKEIQVFGGNIPTNEKIKQLFEFLWSHPEGYPDYFNHLNHINHEYGVIYSYDIDQLSNINKLKYYRELLQFKKLYGLNPIQEIQVIGKSTISLIDKVYNSLFSYNASGASSIAEKYYILAVNTKKVKNHFWPEWLKLLSQSELNDFYKELIHLKNTGKFLNEIQIIGSNQIPYTKKHYIQFIQKYYEVINKLSPTLKKAYGDKFFDYLPDVLIRAFTPLKSYFITFNGTMGWEYFVDYLKSFKEEDLPAGSSGSKISGLTDEDGWYSEEYDFISTDEIDDILKKVYPKRSRLEEIQIVGGVTPMFVTAIGEPDSSGQTYEIDPYILTKFLKDKKYNPNKVNPDGFHIETLEIVRNWPYFNTHSHNDWEFSSKENINKINANFYNWVLTWIKNNKEDNIREIQIVGGNIIMAYPNPQDQEKTYIVKDNNKKLFKIVKWKNYSQTGLFQNPDSINLKKIIKYLDLKKVKYDLIKGRGVMTYINIPNKHINFIK